jgi:hypothetical protein
MKQDSLKQYVNLRQSLLAEKSKLETRLTAINLALSSVSKPAAPAASKAEPAVKAPKAKRKMSAAGRAAIAAAQKARWAKLNAAKKA